MMRVGTVSALGATILMVLAPVLTHRIMNETAVWIDAACIARPWHAHALNIHTSGARCSSA